MIAKLTLCIALCTATMWAVPFQISWVASTGVDNGACGTRVAPCRTFATAIVNTVTGGVIKAVDAADYSLNGAQLLIQKAITIDGAGAGASFIGANDGIVISNVPSGVVTIRNLTVNVPAGYTAIAVVGASAVIENTVVTGPTDFNGLYVDRGSLTADHVSVVGAAYGFRLTSGKASLRNSVVHGCSIGVHVSNNAQSATVMIEHSEVSQNRLGVVADNNGKVRISDSSITFNDSAFFRSRSGQILSYGNNVIDENTDESTTPVLVPLR